MWKKSRKPHRLFWCCNVTVLMNHPWMSLLRAASVLMAWNSSTKNLAYVFINVVSGVHPLSSSLSWIFCISHEGMFIFKQDVLILRVYPVRWVTSLFLQIKSAFFACKRQFSHYCGLFFQFEEEFEYKCQNCICKESTKTVICKPKVCPAPPLTNCTGPGFVLVNQTNPSDRCCSAFVCRKTQSINTYLPSWHFVMLKAVSYCCEWLLVTPNCRLFLISKECQSSTCPNINMNCPVGFVPVVSVPKGKCCPEHTCGELFILLLNLCNLFSADFCRDLYIIPIASLFSQSLKEFASTKTLNMR